MQRYVIFFMVIFSSACVFKSDPTSTASLYWLSDSELQSLKLKSLNGDSAAGFKVGNYFSNIKNDHKEALFWYRLSAEQDNNDSALALAYYYSEVFNDLEKAIYWYEFVGLQKPDLVSYNLGVLYEKKEQIDKAISYYCQAYRNNSDRHPSLNLSEIYLNQKLSEGLAWGLIYGEELHKGSFAWSENTERLSNIKKSMSQADIAKAKDLIHNRMLCQLH